MIVAIYFILLVTRKTSEGSQIGHATNIVGAEQPLIGKTVTNNEEPSSAVIETENISAEGSLPGDHRPEDEATNKKSREEPSEEESLAGDHNKATTESNNESDGSEKSSEQESLDGDHTEEKIPTKSEDLLLPNRQKRLANESADRSEKSMRLDPEQPLKRSNRAKSKLQWSKEMGRDNHLA